MSEALAQRRPIRHSLLERFLGLFTDVRPGEGPAAISMLASVFLVLAAYYFVKPARDGLLAVSPAGGLSETELKAYSSFGQSLCLAAALPLYDHIQNRLRRRALVTTVTLFFAGNLVLFWLLQPGLMFERLGFVGVAFYLWVGIFNVFIVAQVWSFAADIYSDEAGKRLFPLIAVGATAGATFGAWLSRELVFAFGTYGLLLVAAVVLSGSLVTMRIAETRGPNGGGSLPDSGGGTVTDRSGGFALILHHKYLLATALMILALNWVNTNGENFLFGAVENHLSHAAAAQGLSEQAASTFIRDQTTRFYGDLFFRVNLLALALQAFAASRMLRYGGFAAILLVLPLISFASYVTMALYPTLGVMRRMKIAENATDYSFNNTAKQVLWLPTTTAMKYRAKATIDTFCVRAGDGLAAVTAFVLARLLGAPIEAMFAFNASLVLLWLGLAVLVAREHARLSSAVAR
jgi:ATP:ADP antiporter, AAA family